MQLRRVSLAVLFGLTLLVRPSVAGEQAGKNPGDEIPLDKLTPAEQAATIDATAKDRAQSSGPVAWTSVASQLVTYAQYMQAVAVPAELASRVLDRSQLLDVVRRLVGRRARRWNL